MRRLLLLFVFVLSLHSSYAQLPGNRSNASFNVGEQLKYRLRYGFITAAEATIRVLDTDTKFGGKPVYHLVAEGKTAASFNLFYKVRNRYDSYIDKSTLLPYFYTENIREANYRRNDKVHFDQEHNKIVANKGTFSGRDKTFDLVSAFYYARNLDMTNIKPGYSFGIPYFLDDEVAEMRITFVGRERIKTPLGTYTCLKFNPSIKPGRIFKSNSKLYLWITDDGNRIPVKAQVEILVGSVTLEATAASGLKYSGQ